MNFCSIVSREWKTNIKTVFSVMSLILLHLVLSTPTEAVTAWQRAVVRASDEQVYEIQYTKPLNVENFSIRGLDGTIPSRETAAELYIAAQILNNPSIAAHLYNREELLNLVHGEALHTAEWRGYHTFATFVGSVSAGHLVSVVTGAIGISANLIESEVGKAVVQALTTTRLIVGEEQVATEAYVVTQAYIEFAFAKRRIFDELVSSAEVGTEVSIAEIRSAYNALIQADVYVQYAFWMLDEYLVLPDRWERLWTFAKTIFPPTAIGQYFASFGENIEDLRNLQTVFAESARRILTLAAAEVNATFSEAEKSKFIWNLASAGFFERQPPTIAAFIEDMQLMVDNDARLLDLTTKFSDLNGDQLEHTVEVTDSTVADVALILFVPDGESTSKPFLEITPKRVGSTSVTIQATDPTRLSATQTFTITVEPAPLPNQPPEAVNTIPAQSLTLGSASPPLELSTYFHDPDGGTIFYTAESRNPAVATTQRTGSQLTILPQGIGTATITVTAENSDDVSDTQTFTVIVTANETPTERPTAQGLSNGDAIVVQNTGSIGLNIRSAPQVRNQNPDNRIGLVYDGAMGTITAGPRESDDGYIWWEVQWDTSNNRGWSVEAIGAVGLLARRPPEPVTQSFDLEIQPLSVSKQSLDAGESFTLSITIHNNGPGNSPGPELSYYHSLSPGFSPTDPPQLQGTLSVGPLASGESRTQLIQLEAPATPKTYYYGAWLSANSGDTYLNNDFATELGVTVVDDTIADPVDTSDPPDLVIANISVDYDRMYPGERFTISATVRNAGGRQAANARVRYYSSSDEIYSPDDEELPNTDDFIGRLEGGETSNETANLDAPDEQGVYYYIARAEPVQNEVDTDNNYAAIKITVLPPAAPDLVVSLLVPIWGRGKITSRPGNEYFIDPDEFFRLEATINNQGAAEAEATSIHFYRSLDPIPSPERDEFIETKELREFRDPDSRFYDPREQWSRILAPEKPGTYYYYACVDSVPGERYTDNNCSNVVTLKVRGPDLVVYSVSVDYHSRTNTVYPNGIFDLDITVRNQGTEDADDTTLRYYISSDPIRSSDDTEVATDLVFSLDMNETSKTYKENWIRVPYTSGFFYALVCVDSVEAETDTANNCYAPIKITVRNFGPQAEGTIPAQALTVGTSTPLDVSTYFADTNNDDLTYTASSSAPNIVTVVMSGAQVTFTPHRSGSGTITVTASDGEFTATQTLSVSVMEIETKFPDLRVESASVNKTTVAPGETFRLDAVVKNQGEADASAITVRYYQSADDTISSTDTERNTTTLGLIAVDGTHEPSVQLTAPDTPGTYYYGACIDGVVGESDTTNNCSDPVIVTVGGPDLIIESVSANKTTVNPGEHFQIVAIARNQGKIYSPAPIIRFYASTDEIISTEDTLVATRDTPSTLSVNKTLQRTEGITAPEAPGTYYYGVCIDEVASETDTTNNCSQAIAITVEGADLRIDGTPQVSKTTLALGETFQINTRVWNQGKAASGATTLRYYLSADDTISPEDTEVASDRVDALSGRGASANRRRAEISQTLTAPDTPGVHYYGVCVDSVAGDANTLNNCSQAIEITVEAPPPDPTIPADPVLIPRPEAPDLVISAGRVDKSTIKQGQGVRLHITLTNRGLRPAPATKIRYYRSTDATISPEEDTELREVPVGGLGPGKSYTTWALLPSPFAVGVYYYGACLDAVESEFDTTNNCSDTIEITTEAQGTGTQQLFPSGTIETQSLDVGGSPIVLDVSGKFVGKVESYTASSSETSVVTAVISGSEVTLTPVSEGWSIVTIQASSEDLAAKLTFSVSVGNPGTPEPTVTDTAGPDVVDTSPVIWIPDDSLRAAVYDALGLTQAIDLTQQKMKRLTNLVRSAHGVKDLTGLEYATQLTRLNLSHNQISNLTPLQNLTKLTYLNLNTNQITDITPLRNLTALTELHLAHNQISDITPLGNLTNLTGLWLFDNQVSDITPLENLTNLTYLRVSENSIGNITPLRNLTALTELHLAHNQISDVTPLANLTALMYLDLFNNQISDITPLQNLTAIRRLNLFNNQISDVAPLENLANLSRLTIGENPIADLAPLRRLKEKSPGLSIDIDINADLNNAPLAPTASLIPDETALLSNYPNPFNPETWIPYQIAKPADVTLTIHDITGREVRRLALGHRPAGFYRSRGRAAHWDGRNQIGEKVATGLYFYTLTAGDFNATGKMLIQK